MHFEKQNTTNNERERERERERENSKLKLNLNQTSKNSISSNHSFTDTHTLFFMHFHALNEGPLCEFLKIYQSGKPCVMLIRNDDYLIEDNGEILQEKEFTLLGQKFTFQYCVYYTQTLKDLELPFYAWYGKDERASMMAWYNADYLFYILRHFLPQFKHYFLIDYDAFFNGSYKEYFKLYENDETDLFLAYFRKEDEQHPWCWLQETAWIYNEKARKNWYGCLFSCERISGAALDKLYPRRIKHGEIYSKFDTQKLRAKWLLCEAFVATEAVNMGFSVKSLLNNKMNFDDIDLNERRLFVLPDNHFYHFIKGQFHKRLADKDKNFNAERADFKTEITKLNNEISRLNSELNSLPRKISEQELTNSKLATQEKEQNIKIKKLEVKKLEKELGMKLSKLEPRVVLSLNENLRHSAVARVRNHLAYKLGQAIILCNRSLWGLMSLPFVLSFIKAQYKKEQAAYQTLIKQKPEFKLPKIETYKDYQTALREKECLTYKLGEAIIKADKTWLSGGYIRFYFEAKRLEREFKNRV